MISLTRFHQGERIAINPDLIERIEETPDTVVTLTNGTKYLVQESIDEIIEITQLYRARVLTISRRLDEEPDPAARRLQLLRGHVLPDSGGDSDDNGDSDGFSPSEVPASEVPAP